MAEALSKKEILDSFHGLPLLAYENPVKAASEIYILHCACHNDMVLGAAFFTEQGFAVLPEVAGYSAEVGEKLILSLREACGYDTTGRAAFLEKGLEALLTLAAVEIKAENGKSATQALIEAMHETAWPEETLRAKLIEEGFAMLPDLVSLDPDYAHALLARLATLAKPEALCAKFVEGCLETLPEIVTLDGRIADVLLAKLAAASGMNIKSFAGLAGRAELPLNEGSIERGIQAGHTKMAYVISPPGGAEDRISFAVKDIGSGETKFVSGLFAGTASELLRRSFIEHLFDKKGRRHYRGFVQVARGILRHAAALPDLAETVRGRINEARGKPSARTADA